MERRVTNNAGDWNYHQQYPARPETHQQYGQQYNTPPPPVNASSKTAADPWNWGWEDSNGGGESSNNNSQKDPTWDWSVETVSGGYQETVVSNNATNYVQTSNVHQVWPGGYHQQFPSVYTPQVTNTHDVISDSFNSLSVVNQHPYSNVQQTVFNLVEESKETRQQNAHGEHQDLFYNNKNGDPNQYHSTNTNQAQSYFSGFHSPGSVLGIQQTQNEGLGHLVEENSMHDKNQSVPFNIGSGLRENTFGEVVEASRDIQNKNVQQASTISDASHRGELSTEALSPQWSTESLPSQGSDEISQATDNSNRQSEASNATDGNTSLNCFTSGPGYESFETDQVSSKSHVTRDGKHSASVEYDGQPAHSSHPSDVLHGSEQLSEPSVPFYSTTMQSFSRHSPNPSGSALQAQGLKSAENPVITTGAPFSVVEKVSAGVESLTLNSSHTDVENVEVAPPENSNIRVSPVSAAAPLPPPPVSSPPVAMNRNVEKGANPYAAKGASLNHKYTNKSLTRARGLVSSPHLSSEPDTDNKNSNKSTTSNSMMSKMPTELEISQTTAPKSQASSSAIGLGFINTASQGRMPISCTSEESVNLETVPDNKERPDVDVQVDRKSASPASSSRFHQTPVGQDAVVSHPPLWTQESGLPDNQEVYLDTSPVYSHDQSSHDSFPLDLEISSRSNGWHRTPVSNASDVLRNPVHTELDRVVPGQGEENPQPSNVLMQHSFSGPTPDINVEDIAKRQVPGHQDTVPSLPTVPQSGVSNTVEDISARAVPGGPMAGADIMLPSTLTASVSSMYLHRTVPGQTSGHPLVVASGAENPAVQGEDDTPPPGLSRMVPGESRGPEGQGGDETTVENALDEPRVVTGLAEEGRQTTGASGPSSFRPLPDEPRVVTGVAQDELDNSLGQLTSPMSTSSMPSASSDGHETTDLDADGHDSAGERAQLPSERSETIGSDCVEAFPTITSDLVSRRDAESQRRNDDVDSSNVDVGRHGNSREYYGSVNVREREGPLDHSTESRRYRDDRDSRHYDRDDHMYDHDQNKSPRSRYPYNRDRGRYDDQEYGQHRHYEDQSRQTRRYKHMDDEDDDKEAYTSEGEQKRKRDRERPPPDKARFRDQEDYARYYSRRHREASDSHPRDYRDRERDHDRGERDRDKERDRDRFNDRRLPYDRDYRRHDEYYGHYEDYYSHRSRPSSRSGSRPEFDDERRRDYQPYGAYYYSPRSAYEEYNYRYYLAWQRYMQQQQHYQQQQQQQHVPSHNAAMPEDRGSVHSGRSSTHEELSRHNLERSTEHNVSALEETTTSTTPQRLTPAKFSTAHIKGLFTGSGQFLKVLPHYPLDGQSATVEVHDMSHFLVPDTELTVFPGPLIKGVTHKKSLMNFCTRKIKVAEHDPNLLERDSVVLLWRLLLLLLRQNGMVVGTDIAELLLSHSSSQEDPNSRNVNIPAPTTSTQNVQVAAHATDSENTGEKKHSDSKSLSEEELANTFREYLLYGNTHEALEWAMKYGLWGHALFLASKLGSRTYANVMTRFANGLTLNDPLQTLYQLMSGRLPAAVTCCADERWGDWKPHLAMILSNSSVQPELEHRAIITLGDTLASRGCLYAAHFCYLMAQLEFGSYNQKASKLVLIGSSHSKPFRIFANNEAIQMTEIYIYACQLADPEFDVPQFQIYKLLYAKRLVESGMPKEALQYVEVIARTITARPSMYSIDFMQQVFDLGNRLKVHDVSYSPDAGESEELPWLLHLHTVLDDYLTGAIQPDGPSFGSTSNLSMSEGESAHAHIPSNNLQPEQQQEQLHLDHPQQFLQQPPLQQQHQHQHHHQHQHQHQQQQQQQQQQLQQQQAPQQQLLSSSQLTVDSMNQINYADGSQVLPEPGITNLQDSGVPYNIQTGWVSEEYQREQNLGSEVKQDNESYWPQNHWEGGVALEGSTTVSQHQDHQHNTHVGWEFGSNTANARDGGSTQDEQSRASGFGYYPPQNKQPAESPSGEHHSPVVAHQLTNKAQGPAAAKPKSKKETAKKTSSAPARSSWFGGLWNKLSLRPKNQMILPDDKEPKIVWNSEKQKWVNTDAEDDEDTGDLPLPPKMPEMATSTPHIMSSTTSNGDVKMVPPSGQNMYKMNRSRGSRANYVDVFGGVKNTVQPVPAPEIFPSIAPTQANPPANFFVPAPVHSDDNTPVDFLTAAAEGVGGESSERTQQSYGAPLMFNPSDVSQFAVPHNSASLSKKRYPN